MAFPTPWRLLSSSPDLPLPYRLVSHSVSPILLIQLLCLFPFALPCFAPTAVPQVLQLPSGSTLPSADSSMRPFTSVPPSFVASTVFPLRSRPIRTPLLGLCFFLSLLQASASQWLPLCRSRPPLSFVSSGSLLTCPPSAPAFVSSSSLPRLPTSFPLSVLFRGSFPAVSFDLGSHPFGSVPPPLSSASVLGSAALLFTAPGFASQLLLPFACLPSRVQAFPLTSFVPFVASRSALPSVRLHAFTLRFPRRPL